MKHTAEWYEEHERQRQQLEKLRAELTPLGATVEIWETDEGWDVTIHTAAGATHRVQSVPREG